MKCDETRPGCVQCEKRKVPCPGYRQAFRWSDKYEVFRKENEENDAPMSRTTVLSPEERTFSPSNSAGSFAAGQERVDHNNSLPQHPTPHTRPRHEETRNGFPSSSGGVFSLLDLGNQMELGDSHGGSSFDLRIDSVPRRFDGFETDTLSRHHLHDLLQSTRQNTPSHSNVLSNFPAPIGRSSALSPASQRTVTSEAESRSTLFTQACLDQNIFIRYYCDEICPLNSSFDWPDNPFRRVVSRYIDSSPLIRNCIVSMSAVHLLQDNDRMISLSRKYHSAAVELLSTAIFELEGEAGHPGHPRSLTSGIEYSKQLEEVLLASLLLGISAVSALVRHMITTSLIIPVHVILSHRASYAQLALVRPIRRGYPTFAKCEKAVREMALQPDRRPWLRHSARSTGSGQELHHRCHGLLGSLRSIRY